MCALNVGKGMKLSMKKITKDNLDSFMEYYHGFHDSYITHIHYDTYQEKIELSFDVCWSSKPVLREDNTYETNRTKMKMKLNRVKQCNIKEIFSWDYINHAFMKYLTLEEEEYLCFASDEEDPLLYIVCEEIEYEDLKESW